MSEKVWIPAVPLPYLGWRTDRCAFCGKRFRGKNRRHDYEIHWRRQHEPFVQDRDGPRAAVGVPRAEAERIYAEVHG